jgi:hypothetical protein
MTACIAATCLLCCAVLCCAVLCCAVLCCAVLCCAGWLFPGVLERAGRWGEMAVPPLMLLNLIAAGYKLGHLTDECVKCDLSVTSV